MSALADAPAPAGPLAAYRADLSAGQLQPDAAQLRATQRLDALYQNIVTPSSSWLARLRLPRAARPQAPAGVYLWGPVGRGKTYLADLLCDALTPALCQRVHFHAFMLQVHRALRELRSTQDPVATVARQIAARVRLLCLDELQVHDVADAMVLAPLLEGLMGAGTALVITSNRHPDALYQSGLQRERFLPAVALIKQRLEVLALDGAQDYRALALTDLPRYHWPLGPQAQAALQSAFSHLVPAHAHDGPIEVDGRQIQTRAWASDVGWFDFHELCATARSARDYLLLAERFHTLIVSDVPRIAPQDHDVAHRFMNLVDVLYDAGRDLVISAAVPAHEIYTGERMGFEFQRTVSRLTEMQSTRYQRSRAPA